MPRQSLPERREAENILFEIDGQKYTGTFSRFKNKELAEVFLSAAKPNSTSDINGRDAAIAASLAFQFGCPAETLRNALTRNPDGSASGPLGKFLDLIDKPWSTPPTSPKRESSDDTGK